MTSPIILKTVFSISKMDCPSEENLIRMKLDGIDGIRKLEFDLADRTLVVWHKGSADIIERSILDLDLGGKMLSTDSVGDIDIQEDTRQRKLLLTVLLINFSFFAIELTTGLLSGSMGLAADSLDMLADSVVYGMSLMVVGRAVAAKKRIALWAGSFQVILAAIGLMEVVRRFVTLQDVPSFSIMIIVSVFALLANAICLVLLQTSGSKHEAHIKASLIFTSNDVIINLGVIIAGTLVYLLQSNKPDLIIGTIVFFLVVKGAWNILRLSK